MVIDVKDFSTTIYQTKGEVLGRIMDLTVPEHDDNCCIYMVSMAALYRVSIHADQNGKLSVKLGAVSEAKYGCNSWR